MQALYEAYKDKVAFLFVYTREAHPAREGKEGGARARTPNEVGATRSLQERALAATDCIRGLKFTLPVLIDTMDSQAWNAFRMHQAATAVIDTDGRIAFHSRGPGGAQPQEAEKVLKQLLANQGKLGADVPLSEPAAEPAAEPPARRPTKR